MGGAADLPQRASSPLKRRASDLDAEVSSSHKDDVNMIIVPPSGLPEPAEGPMQSSRTRAQSVDMLRHESEVDRAAGSTVGQGQSTIGTSNPETDIPPIDAQIKTITSFIEAASQEPVKEGERTYLVSNRWMNRVICRGSAARQKSKVEPEGEIGPVDNSDIIQQIIKDSAGTEFVQLKRGSGLSDFTLFPREAWELVMAWYGLMPGSIPITRTAHNTSPKGSLPNILYEFHPPVFTIHRLHGENNNILIPQKLKVENPDAPVFVFSTSTSYLEFLQKIKGSAGIDLPRKVRVWRVPRQQPAAEPLAVAGNAATPPSSRPGSPAAGNAVSAEPCEPQDSWKKLFLDVPAFLKLEKGSQREVVGVPDHSANAKYNGTMNLAMAGLAADETIVLDEHIDHDNFVSNYVTKGSKATSTALTRAGNSSYIGSNSQSNSGRNSPAPSGPVTRGRAQKAGKKQGTVGLSNLGNTCYMNSALQCVRSVEELTKYFLTGHAYEELNTENPLGNGGDVASAYGKLLSEIYKEPVSNSVAPRQFKTTIGKYAPSFSGYGQQDSQEFLGFLLDGLQEDLSRVKKKPYIEKPDSTDDMVNNLEAIREMAAKVWDITKKRDDSVIADLFTGMYKSTLVCPACSKVSITFDPFNNLTLQLPIENSWHHQVFYFPLNDKPLLISVDIDRNASIGTMKEFISKRVAVPASRLFACEEFKAKFYKVYKDFMVASEEISQSDHVAVYEVEDKPTNWPPPRKAKKQKSKSMLNSNNDSDEDDVPAWDDPVAERMLVPVFHRRPSTGGNRYGNRKPWDVNAAPHFIMLTPDEARSEETIKRKILEKVATLTTSREFLEDDEPDASVSDGADPDIVITTGSDADSSGGSKVVANSIDGEDEIVDVTMKDATETPSSFGSFNKHRPKFMVPKSYLNPSLQNMFEVGYFGNSKEMIPSGWNSVDEEKTYPSITSRNPQVQQQEDDDSTNGYKGLGSRTGSESGDENNNFNSNATGSTRMTEESEEDEDLPVLAPRVLPVRPAKSAVRVGSKRRNRGMKTYSRKGNQFGRNFQDDHVADRDAPDEGPLVRLGEGLVVDWYPAAWDAMFCGDSSDDLRGMPTWNNVPTLDDPELEALRASRVKKRKNGISLDDCLNEFGKEEILSEQDTWYCPRCKEHQRASKKFELWKTPDILIMHLKRFSSSGYRRDKLDVLVDFPLENLDLSTRVIETEEGKQEIYDLFAVDDHWGGLGGGHYTAFAVNFHDHLWYEYNDSSVSKVNDLSRIVSPSAYLLFYRRRSDVPLGGPRFKQILQEYDSPPQAQASGDEMSESGEDKGLVGNSSPRGSSSALTGVGAARRQLNHGSTGEGTTTVNPLALEKLPDYQSNEQNDDDVPPLLANDGFELQASIEGDEGIDVGESYSRGNNFIGPVAPSWGFGNLSDLGANTRGHMVSGTGSDMDAASDVVQHDSSASEGSMQNRLEEFNDAFAEDDDGPFVDPSPVPDLDDEGQAASIGLQADLLEQIHSGNSMHYSRHQFSVPGDDEHLEVEEPATEIHIEEHEELKLD